MGELCIKRLSRHPARPSPPPTAKPNQQSHQPTLIPLVLHTSAALAATDTFFSPPVTAAVTKKVQGPITTTWHTPPPAPAAKLLGGCWFLGRSVGRSFMYTYGQRHWSIQTIRTKAKARTYPVSVDPTPAASIELAMASLA